VDLLRTGRIDAAVLPLRRAAASGLVTVMALVQTDAAGPPRRRGEPDRPGLVLTVTRDTLTDHRTDVRAVVRTLQRGMGEAAADPESAVAAMIEADDTLDRARLTTDLERIAPAFSAGVPAPGVLDGPALRAWAKWAGKPLAFDAGLTGPVSRD
jgi:ABC-type nitrate/sulfonate/bicarbonate transport system substrate-binding protein